MENLDLGRVGQVLCMAVVMMITMGAELGSASRHDVGGSKTSWGAPNVNLSQWSSRETFYVDDWLYFGSYDKYQYNVKEVNKTNYENCIDKDVITNVSQGAGRDVFQLTKAKTYYFLSSGGYCFQGLKVAINVLQQIPPTPPPTATSSSSTLSSSLSLIHMITPLLVPLLLLVVRTVDLFD